MKRKLILLLVALLPMITLTTITSCNKDEVIETNTSDNNDSNDGQQDPDIVVTVDGNGNAVGEHKFTKIDVANFYIDDIKYTAVGGDLVVSGYNEEYFKGEAKIISVLKYDGRIMNVVGIADEAFGGKELDSPNTDVGGNVITTGIGYTYNGCSSLTSVTIPNCITSIGEDAFAGCTSLISVTIGNSVTSIGSYAFAGCTNLANITFGYSVSSIGDNAFCRCKNLKKIIISSIASWCGISFSEGDSYHPEHENDTNPLYYAHRLYIDENTVITELVIPEGVTRIANYAFSYCSDLTSVTIPKSVKAIGKYAFGYCSGLTDVYCYAKDPPTNANYKVYLSTNGEEYYVYTSFGKPYIEEYNYTLHVPAASLEMYKITEPWSYFKNIVAL